MTACLERERLILTLAGFCLAALLSSCSHSRNLARTPGTDPDRTRFETYCAGCHLNEGPFMMGEAPPLEGSSWVAGPENRMIRIVLHGLRGKIEVRGKGYNQEMPGFSPVLSDADIAGILSYVRKRFGGVSRPVSLEAVSTIRAAYPGRKELWTVDELLKVP